MKTVQLILRFLPLLRVRGRALIFPNGALVQRLDRLGDAFVINGQLVQGMCERGTRSDRMQCIYRAYRLSREAALGETAVVASSSGWMFPASSMICFFRAEMASMYWP